MNKNIYYISLLYIIFILLLFTIPCIKCQLNNNEQDNEDMPIRYSMDIFDENHIKIERKHYTYNYTRYLFNEFEEMQLLRNISSVELCNDFDIDKQSDEKETILFWATSYTDLLFNRSAVYLNAFPIWANEQKKKGKTFCIRLDDVGWVRNVNDPICDDNKLHDCPDFIILGTTQLAYRYYNDDTLNLNKYFRKYFKKTGKSIESLINKYSFYDYHLDNNWLAVPLIVDFRVLRFNTTTFNNCRKLGYDLHFPPPFEENYWGSNYKETWTWEKAVEYSKWIKECTNRSSFQMIRVNSYEDTKLFITICQSLRIPFITDDVELDVKKCGFRNKIYIKKLSVLKELFENHYVDKWLEEDEVMKWKMNSYPETIEDQPHFRLHESIEYEDGIIINGMAISYPFDRLYPDIKYSYMPGSSTFLGGSGIVITKKAKYPEDFFRFIEILIDEKYPYFTELNIAATPFENSPGKACLYKNNNNNEKTIIDQCNLLLQSNGTFPYYYIKDNNTYVIYLTHISIESVRGISINTNNPLNSGLNNNIFQNKEYKCSNHSNFLEQTITFAGEHRIEIPINENEIIILKSMVDINKYEEQTNDMICSIYDESLRNAKPYQFPYSTFSEINDFEYNSPISLLLAHLYYKHNDTNEGTFEDIINECCDIIDYSFLPNCENSNKIKFNISSCNEKTQKMNIEYLNCKNNGNSIKPFDCPYIPYVNYKGIFIICINIVALIVEILSLTVIIIKRKERCISIGGYYFMIYLIFSSIILDSSVLFWIGKKEKYKCVIKVWLMILGITGFICSYSIKSEIIISAYNNKKITKLNKKYKSYSFYTTIIIIQFSLLFIWTLTQNGIETKQKHLENIGYYDYDDCSLGSEAILTIIFGVDYLLLIISILMAYRGRNMPTEFNESKKIFVTSLISIFLLTSCYVSLMMDLETTTPLFIISFLIIFISLIINIIFVGSKLLIIFNIEVMSAENSCVIVVNSSNVTIEEEFTL